MPRKLPAIYSAIRAVRDNDGKQLIVAETAYAWTLDNGDSLGNSFGPGSEKLGGYKATVQGQATCPRSRYSSSSHRTKKFPTSPCSPSRT